MATPDREDVPVGRALRLANGRVGHFGWKAQSASLLDYLLPTAEDIPPLSLGHMESWSPRNPLGLKGLGEGGAISPPAAIANAVEDALRPLGVEVQATPLSPERVLALIDAARECAPAAPA